MRPQIALSVDKMHELQSLGLDCSDASMVWLVHLADGKTWLSVAGGVIPDNLASTPAYTLEDILMKLSDFDPSFIIQRTLSNLHYYTTSLYHDKPNNCHRGIYEASLGNSLESAFEMLKWALSNHPSKIRWLEK